MAKPNYSFEKRQKELAKKKKKEEKLAQKAAAKTAAKEGETVEGAEYDVEDNDEDTAPSTDDSPAS